MKLAVAVFCSYIFCHKLVNCYYNQHNNSELIKYLKVTGQIHSKAVEDVMLKVDRGNYVQQNAYYDMPQSIGYGVTISAPHMHASALESLKNHLKPGEKVLDVGSGSGYLTACMALMAGRTGLAVGIEHNPGLVEYAKSNVCKDNPELLTTGQLKFIAGDGRQGSPSDGPFNAIHVGAAASVIPQALIDQLKIGGRMVIPVGEEGYTQILYEVDKNEDGSITKRAKGAVVFVPLTSREHHD